jgi:hypothetical protein
VTISNYLSTSLNPTQTIVYAVVGTVVFMAMTSYPIEFWRKLPYVFANIMGIYLFHSILLCPKNGYGLVDAT